MRREQIRLLGVRCDKLGVVQSEPNSAGQDVIALPCVAAGVPEVATLHQWMTFDASNLDRRRMIKGGGGWPKTASGSASKTSVYSGSGVAKIFGRG